MQAQFSNGNITVLAQSNFRRATARFWHPARADGRPHMYIMGKTGTGESTLIANVARQDALHGEGFALLDPHGDLVKQVRLLAELQGYRRTAGFCSVVAGLRGPRYSGRRGPDDGRKTHRRDRAS